MTSIPHSFLSLVEETLHFEYQAGDVTPLGAPYSTGWRTLPCVVVAQTVGGRVQMDVAGGEDFQVNDGEAFCVLPGVNHRLEKMTPAPSLSRWAHFNFTVLNGINLFGLLQIPAHFQGEAAQHLGDISEGLALLRRSEARDLTQVFQKNALGSELAAVLCRDAALTPQGALFFPSARRLAPALAFVEENLAAPITREDLARSVHLSPSRFAAVFKEALGVSPSAYIQNLRLQKAQQMLLSTDWAVAEVAGRAGYDDAFHFSRLFKRRFGTSPAHYRAQVRRSL